jgi:hypothetical protein
LFQVVELMSSSLPTSVFSTAYNTVRDSFMETRMKRKQQLAVQAITDPERHASMKLKRNLKKKQAQKRKNQAHARNRTPIKVSKAELEDTPGKRIRQ